MKIKDILKEDEYGRDQGAMYDSGSNPEYDQVYERAYNAAFEGFDKAYTELKAHFENDDEAIRGELGDIAKEMHRQFSE